MILHLCNILRWLDDFGSITKVTAASSWLPLTNAIWGASLDEMTVREQCRNDGPLCRNVLPDVMRSLYVT